MAPSIRTVFTIALPMYGGSIATGILATRYESPWIFLGGSLFTIALTVFILHKTDYR